VPAGQTLRVCGVRIAAPRLPSTERKQGAASLTAKSLGAFRRRMELRSRGLTDFLEISTKARDPGLRETVTPVRVLTS
jgi:hypothetical protein